MYPIVVYLKQTDRPIKTTHSSHARGKHIFTFNYDVIKIQELKSKTVFRDKLVGLFTLAPLMPDADLDECTEKLIWAVEHNLISASSYMCMATFARLKHSKEVVNDFFTKNRVKTALRVGSGDIRLRNHARNALPWWKPVFDQTFVKSLVNSLRVRNALPWWKPVFDQTFVKSLVNSLRVRNALRVGFGDITS